MKAHLLLCVLALTGMNVGCSFVDYSVQNLIESPLKALDECQTLRRFTLLAREAWKHVQETEPDHHYSADYVDGFIAGYVDYLDAGGSGEPPAAPPDRYQFSQYETPEGLNAVHDWFAGFRHGASMAQGSGQRELVVLPLSLPPRSSANVASPQATQPTTTLPQETAPATPGEVMPQPRTLPRPDPQASPFPRVAPAKFAVEGFVL